MTIDEAKKNLTAYVYFAAGSIPSDVAQALDTVVEAADRARWIPVSERLPEEEGRYLVTFRSERKAYLVGYGNCQMSVCGKKIGYGWYDLHDAVYFDKKSIVAWMPLPEPYHITDPDKKEESNG